MFVTQNQFYVFIAAFSFGLISGAAFSAARFFTAKKGRVLSNAVTAVIFAATAAAYVFYAFRCRFPSLRGYMIAAVFAGIVVYVKFLHILLANFCKMIYNRLKRRNTKE